MTHQRSNLFSELLAFHTHPIRLTAAQEKRCNGESKDDRHDRDEAQGVAVPEEAARCASVQLLVVRMRGMASPIYSLLIAVDSC